MNRLDLGIGLYKERRRAAKQELISPFHWLAKIVRLPVTILEHADLIKTEEDHSRFVKAYSYVTQIAMVGLLFVALTKLGAAGPWSEILKVVAR